MCPELQTNYRREDPVEIVLPTRLQSSGREQRPGYPATWDSTCFTLSTVCLSYKDDRTPCAWSTAAVLVLERVSAVAKRSISETQRFHLRRG